MRILPLINVCASIFYQLLRPNMCTLLRPNDRVEIDFFVRELVKVLQAQEVSKEARGRHAPFRYARYLSRQLKLFAALLPREMHPSSGQALSHGPPRLEPATLDMTMTHTYRTENLPMSWATSPTYSDHAPAGRPVGYDQGTSLPYDAPTTYDSYVSDTNTPESAGGYRNSNSDSNSLSGYPVDYSLLNFMHTMNSSKFSKATPPPGEPEAVQQWWQQMYPVSHACAPEGTDWPMTVADGRRAGVTPDQGSPSLALGQGF